MRAATTPTRRTMKQQTLHAMVSPASVTPILATAGDAKRTTRGTQQTPTVTTSTTTSSSNDNVETTTTSAPTSSPSRAQKRTARSPVVTRTPQLRPRRTPAANGPLRDPYEQHSMDALREECVRRGLSVQERGQGGAKGMVRSKAQFVALLQEADMLAMFERQSRKKTGRRAARAVKFTPPPAPIRVALVAKTVPVSRRAIASAYSAPSAVPALVSAPPLSATAALLPASGAPAIPITASTSLRESTTGKAPVKATKKATRPPPKRKAGQPAVVLKKGPADLTTVRPSVAHEPAAVNVSPKTNVDQPTVPATASAVVTTVQPPKVIDLAAVNVPLLVGASRLASVPTLQRPLSQIPATEEEKRAIPVAVDAINQHIALPDTVDLTGAAHTGIVGVQAPTSLVKLAPAPTPGVTSTQPRTSSPMTTTDAASRIQGTRRAPSPSAHLSTHSAARPPSTHPIRARRGCRFRLINVVLSPDFNTRWSEMNVPVMSRTDVNTLWRDVHISFLCQNSFYDKVHFEDALFENVTPNVIQNHTAQKLQQMWTEIVTTYRRAYNASVKDVEARSFLDYCAGRLDLLYLHMALLLEPELHTLVLSETPRSRVIPATTQGPSDAPKAATSSTREKLRTVPESGEGRQLGTSNGNTHSDHAPRFVELQNPEMLPGWLLEDQAKTAAERDADFNGDQTHQAAVFAAPEVGSRSKKRAASKLKKAETAVNRTPEAGLVPEQVQTRDMVLHSSAINSIDDSASSDYETEESNVPSAPVTQRRAPGKRRRGSSSIDVVELPSSRELVPHPSKRVHTAVTTTMTRSQEMVLPPDEFEIQHNRLRKINESIDQCYRTLSNTDAILNDMHREDVESDLRFYLGIKKRIQEQIVMFMHGF